MLNETPFADVRATPDGVSIPELKWRELLFTGAMQAEGDAYVRVPTRPMSPFRGPDPFPAGVRFRVRREGARVVLARVGPGAPHEAQPAVFELDQLRERQRRGARRYVEFLRVPALSLGLYRLSAGEDDRQQPHGEDEVYLVLAGRARLRVASGAGEPECVHAVVPGTLVFVPAHRAHRFCDIEQDLTLLVMFAPAESVEAG